MNALPWLIPALTSGGLTRDLRRALGPLATLVEDPRVTDVFVLGNGKIYVATDGGCFSAEAQALRGSEALDIARALIELGGRHVDEAEPLVDVALPGGLRVHATLPPVATKGPELSIRVARHRLPDLLSLEIENASVVIPRLIDAVTQRETLLISGATGSGKTTLLGALMAYAPPCERLVVLEEVQEISIDHPHVVALECRQANAEGVGFISLARLVTESLRMRPSRLIVGEVRGAEIVDLLQAFHTGHPGGGTTLHAASLTDVPARLEGLAARAGLTRVGLASQVVGAIHRVIHVVVTPQGSRLLQMGRFDRSRDGELVVAVDEASGH